MKIIENLDETIKEKIYNIFKETIFKCKCGCSFQIDKEDIKIYRLQNVSYGSERFQYNIKYYVECPQCFAQNYFKEFERWYSTNNETIYISKKEK